MISNPMQDLKSIRLRMQEARDDLSNMAVGPRELPKKLRIMQDLANGIAALDRFEKGAIIMGEAERMT